MPSSLSEPEHKKGESNLSLDKLVQKRIEEMMAEIESKGIARKEDFLRSLENYLGQMNTKEDENEIDPTQMQMDPNQMGQMDPNQMGQMDPNQMGQMNPNQMGQMNPNQMGQMDPNQMGQMNPNQIGY